jgi:hypothetical protein
MSIKNNKIGSNEIIELINKRIAYYQKNVEV